MDRNNRGLAEVILFGFIKSSIFALLLTYFMGGQDKLGFGLYAFLLFSIVFLPHDLFRVRMAARQRLRLAGIILLVLLILAYVLLGQGREFSVIIIFALGSSLALLLKKIRADKKV